MKVAAEPEAVSEEIPADLVEVATVRGAYGIRGWVRVAPLAEGTSLLASRSWWLVRSDGPQRLKVEESRRQGRSIVAKLNGCETKDGADRLKGLTVSIARSEFPPTAADEYYWADLIGNEVVNRLGEKLGHVVRVGDSGASHWLEVEDDAELRRIPLAAQYIDEIDLEQKLIRVDWDRQW